jgi:hypothetical protein
MQVWRRPAGSQLSSAQYIIVIIINPMPVLFRWWIPGGEVQMAAAAAAAAATAEVY